MDKKIAGIIATVVGAITLYFVLDALLDLAYENIDATIIRMGSDVSGLLLLLKTIVGFLGFDLVSLLLVIFGAIFTLYKIVSNE